MTVLVLRLAIFTGRTVMTMGPIVIFLITVTSTAYGSIGHSIRRRYHRACCVRSHAYNRSSQLEWGFNHRRSRIYGNTDYGTYAAGQGKREG